MEWLKELLKDVVAEDKMESVLEGYKKEFPKHAVPKSVFNETKQELDTTKQSLTETKALIEGLEKKAGTVEDYETQLSNLKTALDEKDKEYGAEISSIKKKTAYKDMLVDANFTKSAIDLLVKTANYEEMLLNDDGSVQNKDSLITKLTESHSDLIKKVSQDSKLKDDKHQSDDKKPENDMSAAEVFEARGLKPFNRR